MSRSYRTLKQLEKSTVLLHPKWFVRACKDRWDLQEKRLRHWYNQHHNIYESHLTFHLTTLHDGLIHSSGSARVNIHVKENVEKILKECTGRLATKTILFGEEPPYEWDRNNEKQYSNKPAYVVFFAVPVIGVIRHAGTIVKVYTFVGYTPIFCERDPKRYNLFVWGRNAVDMGKCCVLLYPTKVFTCRLASEVKILSHNLNRLFLSDRRVMAAENTNCWYAHKDSFRILTESALIRRDKVPVEPSNKWVYAVNGARIRVYSSYFYPKYEIMKAIFLEEAIKEFVKSSNHFGVQFHQFEQEFLEGYLLEYMKELTYLCAVNNYVWLHNIDPKAIPLLLSDLLPNGFPHV